VRVVRVVATPETSPEAKPEATPAPRLELTDAEKDKIVRVVWHEARGESPEGQQAVIEVIFNRIEADNFPDTTDEVINQPGQFSCAPYLASADPEQAQYDALEAVLYGEPTLPKDVVYFSRGAENDRVWGVIGGHTFCYQYVW
jgi:spore germination cell wall hydrolase CwlJ-like protein